MIKFTDLEIEEINKFASDFYKGCDLVRKTTTICAILTGNGVDEVVSKRRNNGLVKSRKYAYYILYHKGFSYKTIASMFNVSPNVVQRYKYEIDMLMDIDETAQRQLTQIIHSL